jgi:hypothetical protein
VHTSPDLHALTNTIQDASAADSETSEEKCRRSLFLADPEIDRQRLLDRKGERVAGTCEWILEDPTYQSWLQDDPGLLWICGGPGKGKTMMSIFITQKFERQNCDDIIYYFCNSEDDRNSTPSAILRALIWQMMAKRPELASLVLPYFESPERTEDVLSTPGTLFEIFTGLAQDPTMTPMYCLIDGLDECEQDSTRWIASHLAELYRGTQAIKIRTCVVSRDILELKISRQILLDPDNNDKISTDIKNFTSLKMADLTRRHNLSEDLSLRIQTQLLRKSEGTFLWIGYAMNELLSKATVTQILETLEELPAALPALYSRMIHKIAAEKLQTCILILHWVVLAMRSLTLTELADAVEWHVPSQLTPEQAAQDYISLCKPLISTQGGKVVLVHQSVKDYLLRSRPDEDHVVESVRVKNLESHLAMADRCLRVLGGGSALVRYANLYWPEHAKQCGKLAGPWIVKNDHFFGKRSQLRESWWSTYMYTVPSELRPRLRVPWSRPSDLAVAPRNHPTPSPEASNASKAQKGHPKLHMACFIGFTQWVENILASKQRSVIPWKRSLHYHLNTSGTPLHFAILGRNSKTAEYLLEKGADPNSKDRNSATAFSYAILHRVRSQGHDAILERMLAHGADVNIMLCMAIEWGDMDLLELAIKHNASVNTRMKCEWNGTMLTSLHRAASMCSGNAITMIRRLLKAGADPWIKDSNGNTAIQCAQDLYARLGLITQFQKYAEKESSAIVDVFREAMYSGN